MICAVECQLIYWIELRITAMHHKAARLCFALLTGCLVASLFSSEVIGQVPQSGKRPNILFICVDDLRPQLGVYGLSYMKTPNLDRFAGQGRLFKRHYVQVPTCGASRFSMLTSQYPKSAGSYGNGAFAMLHSKSAKASLAKNPKAARSMPEFFRLSGYTTTCIGKVSHQPDGRRLSKEGKGQGQADAEIPGAWTDMLDAAGKWKDPWSAFFGYADGSGRKRGKSPATESADVDDTGYPDGLIAEAAVTKLTDLKKAGKPFFFAVGFYKPHLPFNAPKKYWDLYDPAKLPLSPNPDAPAGANKKYNLHGSGEMFGNYGQHKEKGGVAKRISDPAARHLRHGYFAAVSYVDAQIGKVLTQLDKLGLSENTIVVVWGDHGWHLGDHTIWGKHSTFERSLRSALIIRTPNMKAAGKSTDAIVESVDLYPTLAQLAGLTPPKTLDGRSFTEVLNDPSAKGKTGARGFWRRSGVGHTIRTDRYRLVRWASPKSPGKNVFVELYDHKNDPHETKNIAADQPQRVAELLKQLARDK
jgi:iduronate 2-sulfatase